MHLFSPALATRRWLKVGMAIGGAISGIMFGIVLTRLGKIVAGAPSATLANYALNAAVFGVAAGIISPTLSWSELRRAPLWRTVVEPLAYALAGGAAAVVMGSGVLLLALPPLGLALGYVRLHHRYPDRRALPTDRPAN